MSINPFEEALKNFKPVAKDPEPEVVPKVSEISPTPEGGEELTVVESKTESLEPKAWRHPETGLLEGDQQAFERLCELIGLSKKGRDENRYWRVRDCFDGSPSEDMSFEINRWLGSEMNPTLFWREETRDKDTEALKKAEDVKAIVEPLLQRGYEARAVKWLLSRTPEKMKYGNGSREFRLDEAKKSAEKAGKTIEKIAAEHNLEHLLV